jgi:hypothetical protein
MSRDKYQQNHTISIQEGSGTLIIDGRLQVDGGFASIDYSISPVAEIIAPFSFSDLYIPVDLGSSSVEILTDSDIPVAINWAAGNSDGPWLSLYLNKVLHSLRDVTSGSYNGAITGVLVRWNIEDSLDTDTSISWRISKREFTEASWTTVYSGTILGSTDVTPLITSTDLSGAIANIVPSSGEEWVLLLKSNGSIGGQGPKIYGGSILFQRSSFAPV